MSGIILMAFLIVICLCWTLYDFNTLIKYFCLLNLCEKLSLIIIGVCGVSYTAIFIYSLITLIKGVM